MKKWILAIILGLAFLVQMTVVLPSGSHYCQNDRACGIYFWGAHEHDGVWHLALINNALSTWPAQFPTYAGAILTGYNSLLDWLIKIVQTLTQIPVLTLYFKLIPLAWFGAMAVVYQKFAKVYAKNSWYLPAILFFVFFGNSFSYLFRYYHERIIWGASGLLSMQSPQMLTNIQFALTLPLIGMMLILFKKSALTTQEAIKLAGLNFVLMGLKFYGGVIGIIMSLSYVITLFYQKRPRDGILFGSWALGGFLLATWFFYDPLHNLRGPSILSFRPLSTVHPIIEEAGLFFAPGVANLRNNLYGGGLEWRLVLIELATLSVFVIFNWGTRLIGLWGIKRSAFDFVLLSGIAGGFLLNILFTQRGEWWNTVQFLYYATFLTNIYAARVLSELITGKRILQVLAILIVLLTIPNGIDTYRVFASFPPHSYVSDTELTALNKLKSLPKGIVLALPINPIPGHEGELPRPLYTMYDTAYVAAFSGQQTYLNDLVQMRLTGIEYQTRLEEVSKYRCGVLEKIDYIYIAGSQGQLLNWQKCQMSAIEEIYRNDEASIYLVTTETPNQ